MSVIYHNVVHVLKFSSWRLVQRLHVRVPQGKTTSAVRSLNFCDRRTNTSIKRMHSSRMHMTRSSSHHRWSLHPPHWPGSSQHQTHPGVGICYYVSRGLGVNWCMFGNLPMASKPHWQVNASLLEVIPSTPWHWDPLQHTPWQRPPPPTQHCTHSTPCTLHAAQYGLHAVGMHPTEMEYCSQMWWGVWLGRQRLIIIVSYYFRRATGNHLVIVGEVFSPYCYTFKNSFTR